MRPRSAFALLLVLAVTPACAAMDSLPGSPQYGDISGSAANQADRNGRITSLEAIQLDDSYKLGIGTAAGAVVGGLIGSQVSQGSTTGAVVGAATGAAIGSYGQSRLSKKDAQRITVSMAAGGQATVVQPVDARLTNGMDVRIEGSGESARVVPR
jgi:outer membrane lipoprotein SlyB